MGRRERAAAVTLPDGLELITDRLDEVAGGRLSPYELAAEVVEELKQGERI